MESVCCRDPSVSRSKTTKARTERKQTSDAEAVSCAAVLRKKKQQSKSGRRPKVNKGIIRRQMLVAEEQSVVFFFFLKAAPALLDAQQHATWPHRAKRSAARWGAGWRGWLRYVLRTTRARCWRSEVEEGGKNGQRTTVRNLEKNVSLDVGRITPVTMTPWKTAFQGN